MPIADRQKHERRNQIKKEVLATICQHLRTAMAEGKNPWGEVDLAFPSVPMDVRYEAVVIVENEETEAWWDSLEKTIDGEILNRALAGGGNAR